MHAGGSARVHSHRESRRSNQERFSARAVPSGKHPTSNFQLPTSNIQHPTSNIEHRTSNIQHPTSNNPRIQQSRNPTIQESKNPTIQHRTSNIQHPTIQSFFHQRSAVSRTASQNRPIASLSQTLSQTLSNESVSLLAFRQSCRRSFRQSF